MSDLAWLAVLAVIAALAWPLFNALARRLNSRKDRDR